MQLNVIFVIGLELLAALSGLYYIRKYKVGAYTKGLVYVLFFIVFTEILSIFLPMAVSNELPVFSVLKGTPFNSNLWIHNAQLIITFSFFAMYFRSRLKPGPIAQGMKIAVIAFIVAAITNFFISDVFFNLISKFTMIAGSILILISILLYYFELLRGDSLLQFNKSITFYISVGLLVYYLSMTPLFIYGSYYYTDTGSQSFKKFYLNTLSVANVIMYVTFILGFLLCKPTQK